MFISGRLTRLGQPSARIIAALGHCPKSVNPIARMSAIGTIT